jgi:hypothetical protein
MRLSFTTKLPDIHPTAQQTKSKHLNPSISCPTALFHSAISIFFFFFLFLKIPLFSTIMPLTTAGEHFVLGLDIHHEDQKCNE